MSNQDLVYRLRTCAAAMVAEDIDYVVRAAALRDVSTLLVEASNALDAPESLGEPMPVLEAARRGPEGITWTTGSSELPSVAPKPCPSCGNVAARKVRIVKRQLFITCPMCTHEWEYKP